jgi:hypothetical protein
MAGVHDASKQRAVIEEVFFSTAFKNKLFVSSSEPLISRRPSMSSLEGQQEGEQEEEDQARFIVLPKRSHLFPSLHSVEWMCYSHMAEKLTSQSFTKKQNVTPTVKQFLQMKGVTVVNAQWLHEVGLMNMSLDSATTTGSSGGDKRPFQSIEVTSKVDPALKDVAALEERGYSRTYIQNAVRLSTERKKELFSQFFMPLYNPELPTYVETFQNESYSSISAPTASFMSKFHSSEDCLQVKVEGCYGLLQLRTPPLYIPLPTLHTYQEYIFHLHNEDPSLAESESKKDVLRKRMRKEKARLVHSLDAFAAYEFWRLFFLGKIEVFMDMWTDLVESEREDRRGKKEEEDEEEDEEEEGFLEPFLLIKHPHHLSSSSSSSSSFASKFTKLCSYSREHGINSVRSLKVRWEQSSQTQQQVWSLVASFFPTASEGQLAMLRECFETVMEEI